jgi:G8 domain-containing protein
MKTLYSITFFLFITSISFANPKIKVISNGNWNNNSSWDLNRMPVNGDTVIIPAGRTITIIDNQNLGASFMYIKVYGTLKLSGGKLTLNSSSVILVYGGGKITSSGSPSEKIKIGNDEKYRGTDADVNGPQMADQNSGSGFVGFNPLPVKFIAFNVSKQNNNVIVEWITAEEVNSSYYEIQRSLNGNEWTAIGTLNAALNSNSTKTYSYTDKNISAKTVYYRIRQVDVDGKFVITPVRSVKMQGSAAEIKITAAADNSVYVHFSEELKNNVTISITSFAGHSISKQTLNHPVGQVQVQAHTTLHGAYIVTVNDGNGLSVSKQILL